MFEISRKSSADASATITGHMPGARCSLQFVLTSYLRSQYYRVQHCSDNCQVLCLWPTVMHL
eukprot:6210689-Pleurochrysis_carterae.AAC.3